ncbi:hypothetical protein N7450_007086 [Penicillium hetheringtonii]|uniref:Uncharacterized protein n=1 Tax=Penicillium hetheringtonii TaxID=911720 RepID=A0AAD6DGQ3_9EURO|nr:hypothetical protein N7450_007086 [Penicillium hetheringtonii]
MMRPRDPRFRQRINQLSHNLETANETAQEGLYTFSQNYLSPCLATIGNCIQTCTDPCLPGREDHLRRRRRGRAEANFDFYDDWDNEEADDTLLGWGTGELDRLLAGSGLARGNTEQPRRPRRMSYGTRHTRRRSTVHIPDNRSDPTVIPSSSLIGFLERFPWRFGAKGVKYRPSAADLQEHPGSFKRHSQEDEPLMEATEDEGGEVSYAENTRNRSSTQSSKETSTSLSSRGDLFPSDEEEDAVPLDDEFALTFGRRGTGLESDDQSGTKPEVMRSASRTSSLAEASSKKSKKNKKKKRSSNKSPMSTDTGFIESVDALSIADIKMEEERMRLEEESAIERNRLAAQELAHKRGLDRDGTDPNIQPSQQTEQPSNAALNQAFYLTNEPKAPNNNSTRKSSDSSALRSPEDQSEPFPPLGKDAPATAGPSDNPGTSTRSESF